MAISYPYNPPASPAPASMLWRGISITGMSQSPFSLAQQVQDLGGDAWLVQVVLPPMQRATAEAWLAWRLALRGRLGTFELLVEPGARAPRGNPGSGVVADSAGSPAANLARDITLRVRGLPNNQVNAFRAGDFISFTVAGRLRLHKVLRDVNADSSGRAALDIWPRLRGAVVDNAAISSSNCAGSFRLIDNEAAWDIGEARIYGLEFQAMEALP